MTDSQFNTVISLLVANLGATTDSMTLGIFSGALMVMAFLLSEPVKAFMKGWKDG